MARRAGVTRATVYHNFSSKLGLLDALMLDTERRAGMVGLEAAGRAQPTLADAVRFGLRELCACWGREQTTFRHLLGLATVDPEARQVVERHDARWRSGIEQFARDLDRAGLLRPGWSVRRAAAVLHLLFSFETFDRLQVRGGLSERAAVETLTELAATVVRL